MSTMRDVLANQPTMPPLKIGATTVCAIPGKGRGVRAACDLLAGDVIEIAPTIELDSVQSQQIEETPVGPFYFEHPLDTEKGIVILGLTSVVNHSDTPNAAVQWIHQEGPGWLALLRILNPVATGDEITHRYQCPTWFDVV